MSDATAGEKIERFEYLVVMDFSNREDEKNKLKQYFAGLEAKNAELAERIEYANAGDLVTIPRELVLAMEAKMKEHAADVARLTAELAQCKHALDDEGEDNETCNCGKELHDFTCPIYCTEQVKR